MHQRGKGGIVHNDKHNLSIIRVEGIDISFQKYYNEIIKKKELIILSKNLIIYYSRKGQNYVNGRIESLTKGNTEICAEFIQKAVGGDLFEV